jgi:predicted amidohydrolase YtcJ
MLAQGAAIGCAAAFLSRSRALAASSRGFLLHGGRIHTGHRGGIVEALLVRDGLVAFGGRLSDAPGSDAQRIDLRGATAFPGFADAHVHLLGVGLREISLGLSHIRSIAELQDALRTYASEHRFGPIIGGGWLETHWPERRMPTRHDLDAVVPDRPVWLERADGHSGVANSAALALAGIDADTADPPGGRIERDPSGAATGMLIDRATGLVDAKLPEPGPDTIGLALAKAVDLYASLGWTGVADMGMRRDVRAILVDMAAEGRLPIRVDCYMRDGEADELLALGPSSDPSGLVRTLGIKLFLDGALGSRGALLLEPYSDRPETSGLQVTPTARIRERLRQARRVGAQVAIHAIGDRANRMALDLYEDTWSDDLPALRRARWRIEHAQIIDPADIPRFGRLGVIASMQPSHAIGDLYFAPERLGETRLAGAYAWRSLVESGAIVCGGSDAPYDNDDPRVQYYAAAYRHDLKGKAGEGWHLEEALDRDAALALFTRNAAFAARHDDALGSLEVGKRADISVFEDDLTTCDPARMLKTKCIMTIVDGTVRSGRSPQSR